MSRHVVFASRCVHRRREETARGHNGSRSRHPDHDAVEAVEQVSESPFYIPMTGPAARPRRSLKHDDTFIVLDSHGDIGASAGGPDGLFNADTRYLARLEMVLDDVQPLLLGSNLRDDNSALTVDLTNPDVYRNGRIVLQKDMLHIVRTIFLWRGTAYQRIGAAEPRRPAGELRPDAAVRQRFRRSVRGARRSAARAAASAPAKLLGPADVVLEYSGLDGQIARHRAAFRSAADAACGQCRDLSFRTGAEAGHLAVRRGILQQADHAQAGAVLPRPAGASPRDAALDGGRDQHRNLQQHLQRGAVPGDGRPQHADDGNAAGPISLCRHSLVFDDIRPRRPDHRAADAVDRSAHRAAACCRRLAFFQAKAVDPLADAEPGKILHEMRGGEMAALREVPFAQYYGSVDSTPLFVLLAGLYVERTGDEETLAELWPAIEAALQWIDGPGDPDRRRLCRISARHRSRGWPIRAGRIPTTRSSTPTDGWPKATSRWPKCRATSSPASGWRRAARGAWDLTDRAAKLEAEAQLLAERFEEAFWCEELGTYALALDGAKQPCRVRTSNAGQLLFTGIVQRGPRPPGRRRPDAARNSSRAGASAPSRAARRATIRCPITTARSGRTTTR